MPTSADMVFCYYISIMPQSACGVFIINSQPIRYIYIYTPESVVTSLVLGSSLVGLLSKVANTTNFSQSLKLSCISCQPLARVRHN